MNESEDIGAEAVEVANKINQACKGHSTAATLIAIGMMLGFSESLAERPDLAKLMVLIEKCARDEFQRRMQN